MWWEGRRRWFSGLRGKHRAIPVSETVLLSQSPPESLSEHCVLCGVPLCRDCAVWCGVSCAVVTWLRGRQEPEPEPEPPSPPVTALAAAAAAAAADYSSCSEEVHGPALLTACLPPPAVPACRPSPACCMVHRKTVASVHVVAKSPACSCFCLDGCMTDILA